MSEPIEFPLNFERYMALGEAAIAADNGGEAIAYFEAAYNLKASFSANKALVKGLVQQSLFQQGKSIADEMKSDYLGNPTDFQLYLTLLLGTEEFIQSRKLLRGRHGHEGAEGPALMAQVVQGEAYFRTFHQRKLVKRQQLTDRISEGNFMAQAQVLRAIEKLPLEEYVALATSLLATESVGLLLRNALLESLTELGGETELSVLTLLADRRQVNTKTLPLIEQQASYQQARHVLIRVLATSQSELSHQLQEELRLQFTLLYPFADELIKDSSLWVDLFLSRYLGEPAAAASQAELNEGYLSLQDKIQKELLKMTL